eukprot:5061973-Prymnesium_polylepis.1
MQIFSHVSYIALSQTNGSQSLNASGLGCPRLDFAVEGVSDLSCLQAAAFFADDRPDGADVRAVIAINRCHRPVLASTPLAGEEALTATITTYHGDDVGTWTNISQLPPGFHHPWTNGPLHPNVSHISLDGQPVVLE